MSEQQTGGDGSVKWQIRAESVKQHEFEEVPAGRVSTCLDRFAHAQTAFNYQRQCKIQSAGHDKCRNDTQQGPNRDQDANEERGTQQRC